MGRGVVEGLEMGELVMESRSESEMGSFGSEGKEVEALRSWVGTGVVKGLRRLLLVGRIGVNVDCEDGEEE